MGPGTVTALNPQIIAEVLRDLPPLGHIVNTSGRANLGVQGSNHTTGAAAFSRGACVLPPAPATSDPSSRDSS